MADAGYERDGISEPDKSEESLLLSRLKRVEANPSGVYSIHIHMSKLSASNRQSHILKIATNSLLELEKSYEAKAFSMSNADVILICRNVPVEEVDSAIDMARYTFSEDPILLLGDTEDDDFEDAFSTWYDLSQSEDYSVFLSIANDLAAEADSSQRPQLMGKSKEDKERGEPLSAHNLDAINQSLQKIRIADIVHKQVCIEMGPEGPGDEIFKEHSISMVGLKKRISPEVNLFASPCLFQYLTETLDKRMLAVLGNRDFNKLPFNISINLNVSTVMSRGFQNFDHFVGKNTSKVIVELQILDIFSDMGSFSQARDTLQERGYRVLVDGINPLALQFFDPTLLKSNFLKINWNPDYDGEVEPDLLKDLRTVIESAGKGGVILARVNSNKAIKWGMGLGITNFQGFFVDALMEKIGGIEAQQERKIPKTKEKVKAQSATPSNAQPATVKSAAPVKPKLESKGIEGKA